MFPAQPTTFHVIMHYYHGNNQMCDHFGFILCRQIRKTITSIMPTFSYQDCFLLKSAEINPLIPTSPQPSLEIMYAQATTAVKAK